MGRLSRPMMALAVTSLLFVGGGAYALAASNRGTIAVCINHKSGTLYKAKKCAKHDGKLSWNQQGPPGPPGANGSPGPQGPPGTVDTSNVYTKGESDSRYLQGAQAVTGQSAVGTSGYGLGTLTTLRQVTVDVGPTARHILIEADADFWSGSSATCDGFIQLSWDSQRQSTTNASATAPNNGGTNGRASLATSAMPLLSSGAHVVALSGVANDTGCIGFQDSRLNVVVLSN